MIVEPGHLADSVRPGEGNQIVTGRWRSEDHVEEITPKCPASQALGRVQGQDPPSGETPTRSQ